MNRSSKLTAKRVSCILALLAFVGCHETTTQILVESEPSGARIMVDENYVGDAPCTIRLKRGDANYDVVAYPAKGTTGYLQQKILWSNRALPTRILFLMNIRHDPSQIDANLNTKNE